MVDHSIKGKTVLIAGGAKNLGGLIARDLAVHGAGAIAIHYNSATSKADADDTVAAVKALGAQAVAFQANLVTAGATEKLFADTIAAVGKPDIAINTVGKVLKKPMAEISEAEYDEMSAVNAKAAFFFIKEAGKQIKDNGKICTLVTSPARRLYAILLQLCRHKSSGGTLHARSFKGIWRTRYFSNRYRTWPDGYAVFTQLKAPTRLPITKQLQRCRISRKQD